MRMLPSPMVGKATPTRGRSSELTRVEVSLVGSTMRMAWAPAVKKSPFRLMLFPASYRHHALSPYCSAAPPPHACKADRRTDGISVHACRSSDRGMCMQGNVMNNACRASDRHRQTVRVGRQAQWADLQQSVHGCQAAKSGRKLQLPQ